MRPALIVPLVLAGVMGAPLARTSEACMCAPATLSSLLGSASAVLAGRVVEVSRVGYDVAVRIEVDRVYKGGATPGSVVTIALHDRFLGDHQTPGRIGQRWMVFAAPYVPTPDRREPRWRHRPVLMTGSCAGNWRITAKHPAPDAIAPPPPPSLRSFLPLPSPPPPAPSLP